MTEDESKRGLYETIGRALSAAECAFYEELEDNDIDITEREIRIRFSVFEREDWGNDKSWEIQLGEIDDREKDVKKGR